MRGGNAHSPVHTKTEKVPGRGAARNTDARQSRMTNGNSKSRPSQPTSASQSTASHLRKGESSGNRQCNSFLPLRIHFNSIVTFQRANALRSQGFTPDNNPELQNLLRFISNLHTQQTQQSGVFPSMLILHWLNFTPHSPPRTTGASKFRSFSCCKWPPFRPTAGTAHPEWNGRLPSEFSRFWFLPDKSSSPWAFHYPSLVYTRADKRSPRTNSCLQDFAAWSTSICGAPEHYPSSSV
jgi:hypothetical protein